MHLVRVGNLGHVGRFASAEALRYPRRARVVVRTRRGLEVGEVLSPRSVEIAALSQFVLRVLERLPARRQLFAGRLFAVACSGHSLGDFRFARRQIGQLSLQPEDRLLDAGELRLGGFDLAGQGSGGLQLGDIFGPPLVGRVARLLILKTDRLRLALALGKFACLGRQRRFGGGDFPFGRLQP